jgi:hypothetical protein
MAVRVVLSTWREFFNEERSAGQTRYRLYHASFQDFLADEIGLLTYHDAIGETALAKNPRLPR